MKINLITHHNSNLSYNHHFLKFCVSKIKNKSKPCTVFFNVIYMDRIQWKALLGKMLRAVLFAKYLYIPLPIIVASFTKVPGSNGLPDLCLTENRHGNLSSPYKDF